MAGRRGHGEAGTAARPRKAANPFYGYKLHIKSDVDHGLIRDLAGTTASVHDSRVDLSEEGEVVYRDKGYFGVEPKG